MNRRKKTTVGEVLWEEYLLPQFGDFKSLADVFEGMHYVDTFAADFGYNLQDLLPLLRGGYEFTDSQLTLLSQLFGTSEQFWFNLRDGKAEEEETRWKPGDMARSLRDYAIEIDDRALIGEGAVEEVIKVYKDDGDTIIVCKGPRGEYRFNAKDFEKVEEEESEGDK